MQGLLFLLALFFVLSGPVAVIVSFVTLRRLRELQGRMDELARTSRGSVAASRAPVPARSETMKTIWPAPGIDESRREPVAQAPAVRTEEAPRPAPQPVTVDAFFQKDSETRPTPTPARQNGGISLEQRIGTRWVLIAGVITVMFAVGFFLKYAYDQRWISPLGRVLIAGLSGLAALVIGEATRRRAYDIVAKGVTALGFAILYATVFAAHRWYGLINSPTAFVFAIGVTAGAMFYAVVLDEIVIAMLSLIGGYLTPVVLSTGQNQPALLFSYVLILSAGAVVCAYWRKWSPVNILVLLGTYLLYTGWFEKFYRPAMSREGSPEQLGVALFWLTMFFFIYLALPLLHTLVRRVKSAPQDIVLVPANAAVVFYYLWTILNHDYRAALAWCSVGMGAAHLAAAAAVIVRCRQDSDLWQVLLIAGLAFITMAVPLYFEVYAVAMLWGIEGVLLVVAGLRYRSLPMQLAGGIVLALAVGDLVTGLPLHVDPFTPVFNTAFGTWCFIAAAVTVCHLLYRFDKRVDPDLRSTCTQGLYVAALGLSMLAVVMELWWHARLNMPVTRGHAFFWEQMALVFAVFILLFVARPVCPRGPLSRALGTLLAASAAIYVLAALPGVHERNFTIFVNGDFTRAILLVAVLFASAWLLRQTERHEPDAFVASGVVALGTIVVLWLLLTEEIWLYYDRLRPSDQWRFLMQMYISILWAIYATVLMAVGFWRRVRPLRYMALGIFVLLLVKIFLVDTRELETVYRIAGFLVTGLALVGVSYLYQYLKKTGFFDTMLAEKKGPSDA